MSNGTTWSLAAAVAGSEVLVDKGRYGGVPHISRVVTAGKTKIVLDDKSEWTRRGRGWGTTTDRWMTGPRASLVTDSVAARKYVQRLGAKAALDSARHDIGNRFDALHGHLSMEEIAAVNAILDAHKAACATAAESPADERNRRGSGA